MCDEYFYSNIKSNKLLWLVDTLFYDKRNKNAINKIQFWMNIIFIYREQKQQKWPVVCYTSHTNLQWRCIKRNAIQFNAAYNNIPSIHSAPRTIFHRNEFHTKLLYKLINLLLVPAHVFINNMLKKWVCIS